MIQELTINKKPPILGGFGKAIKGAVSLNFGRSGGKHCATACPYHPRSTSKYASVEAARCYAATCESRPDRTQLASKLDRHEDTEPVELIDAARVEFAKKAARGGGVPWFRFSSFGSVPDIVPHNFRQFCLEILAAGTPIHLPIEESETVSTYLAAVGDIVTVRASVAAPEFNAYNGACTTVVGDMKANTPRERVALASIAAKARTAASGRKCIVCPAVAAQHLRTKSKAAKCGNCTACAKKDIDVIYPAHH